MTRKSKLYYAENNRLGAENARLLWVVQAGDDLCEAVEAFIDGMADVDLELMVACYRAAQSGAAEESP